jgi:hypothetical protein
MRRREEKSVKRADREKKGEKLNSTELRWFRRC